MHRRGELAGTIRPAGLAGGPGPPGEAGYRVSIVSPKAPGYEADYEVVEGVEIYRHSLWEAGGVLGYFVEYTWALLAEFLLTLKVYRRSRFRILHACNPPDTIFLIGLFFKLFGVRFVFDHHDLSPELFEAKFGKRHRLVYWLLCVAEWLTFRTADVSIATNQSYREVAIRRGKMPPERVFMVRSCPDLGKIRRQLPRPELKEGKRFMVVYLGVMGQQEGLDLLLQSIEYIAKPGERVSGTSADPNRDVSRRHSTWDDILFVFIGGGTDLPHIKVLAKTKGLDSVVRFTGRISDQDLAAYLSTADVCVAPDPLNSMNDKSTMNKVLEYMAYGRPVVLYDLTEGRRSAGDAALYARPNDPVDFAVQIIRLLNSESLRNELGARGRQRIESHLNWDLEKKALLAAYDAVRARCR